MIKSNKAALATHLGWDIKDLTDYNYQPSRFTRTVYTIGDNYYCATKDINKLPQRIGKNAEQFDWTEVKDSFVNSYGYYIFKYVPVLYRE